MMEGNPPYKGMTTFNAPLKMLNSWHIGGCADRTYVPVDLHDLSLFLGSLPPDEPLTWLGLGSNVLIRDKGIRGTVILTQGAIDKLVLLEDNRIYAQAGVTCAKIAKFAARHDVVGAEFFAGIPGTLGGALRMNAGAFGGETWNAVAQVEVMDRAGRVTLHDRADIETGYRTVTCAPDTWFVGAYLSLAKGDGAESEVRVKALLKKRSETQPIGLLSCGSVFRNPPDDHAARLIECCGLKGLVVGGAQISPKHANFIINLGNASSSDVEHLIRRIEGTVLEQTGVQLYREVCILGEA